MLERRGKELEEEENFYQSEENVKQPDNIHKLEENVYQPEGNVYHQEDVCQPENVYQPEENNHQSVLSPVLTEMETKEPIETVVEHSFKSTFVAEDENANSFQVSCKISWLKVCKKALF